MQYHFFHEGSLNPLPSNVRRNYDEVICDFKNFGEWFSTAEQMAHLGHSSVAVELRVAAQSHILRRVAEIAAANPVAACKQAFRERWNLALAGVLPDYQLSVLANMQHN